jgi:hypothetical protein
MKHDPSMHTVMHLVFFGKRGVTNTLNHGNQYSFLFSPCVPYKTQFSPPSFPYPRAASATTASARVLTPLPSGLLLPVGLVFPVVWQAPLSRHKLPRRGSSTQASEPPPPTGVRQRCRPRGGSHTGCADLYPYLEGCGGDAPPSPTSILQSRIEGGDSDVTRC